MKAIVQDEYGAPDEVLELHEIEEPRVEDGDVLVRVHAAGVSTGDWHLLRGRPYLMRPMFGLLGPRQAVPGFDLAGKVKAVGPDVRGLLPGDEVFGWSDGAFAEFASAPEENFLRKPEDLSFEQAAALGDSAITALKAVRDQADVRGGDRVLIYGASGGVGTFAVQIAKAFGAHVTGVCSTPNVALVGSLGADEVIDYTKGDFTELEDRYDVMLDVVGNRSLSDCRRVLTRKGTYVLVGVLEMDRWFGLTRQLKLLASSPLVSQKLKAFIAMRNRDDLAALRDMVEAGMLTPVVDSSYELSEVPEALLQQGEGHTRGKIAIAV